MRAGQHRAVGLALWLGLGAASGCDEEQEEPELFDPADVVVAERSNSSLKATVNLAHVADIYRANDFGNIALNEAQVRAFAVIGLNLSLEHVYRVFACEPMIETDNATYVQATFVGCSTLFLELEGTARADITVISDEDGPSAISWRVDGTNFSIHNPRQEFTPLFRGIVGLTTPLRGGGAMQWETGANGEPFEIDLDIGRFDARSIASWTIDENECVTMDLEAQLTQLDGDDDLDEEIGDIVVSVEALRQCQDRCPEEGSVNLVYGAGELLQWTYTAENVVQISGPHNRHFEATLPCD
jgi:hypothetical protein